MADTRKSIINYSADAINTKLEVINAGQGGDKTTVITRLKINTPDDVIAVNTISGDRIKAGTITNDLIKSRELDSEVIKIGGIENSNLKCPWIKVNDKSCDLGSEITLTADDIGEGTTNTCYTKTEQTKLAEISPNAKKVEASTTNGKIKIDGVETTVYTEVANTVHDANYKHIDVTSTTVTTDGTTLNISGKADDNTVVHLDGDEIIVGNKTFSNPIYFSDTTATPFTISNNGKIGMRARTPILDSNGDPVLNEYGEPNYSQVGQFNVSNAWYKTDEVDNLFGAQMSAYDGVNKVHNQIRVSHNGPQYIVYGSEDQQNVFDIITDETSIGSRTIKFKYNDESEAFSEFSLDDMSTEPLIINLKSPAAVEKIEKITDTTTNSVNFGLNSVNILNTTKSNTGSKTNKISVSGGIIGGITLASTGLLNLSSINAAAATLNGSMMLTSSNLKSRLYKTIRLKEDNPGTFTKYLTIWGRAGNDFCTCYFNGLIYADMGISLRLGEFIDTNWEDIISTDLPRKILLTINRMYIPVQGAQPSSDLVQIELTNATNGVNIYRAILDAERLEDEHEEICIKVTKNSFDNQLKCDIGGISL